MDKIINIVYLIFLTFIIFFVSIALLFTFYSRPINIRWGNLESLQGLYALHLDHLEEFVPLTLSLHWETGTFSIHGVFDMPMFIFGEYSFENGVFKLNELGRVEQYFDNNVILDYYGIFEPQWREALVDEIGNLEYFRIINFFRDIELIIDGNALRFHRESNSTTLFHLQFMENR